MCAACGLFCAGSYSTTDTAGNERPLCEECTDGLPVEELRARITKRDHEAHLATIANAGLKQVADEWAKNPIAQAERSYRSALLATADRIPDITEADYQQIESLANDSMHELVFVCAFARDHERVDAANAVDVVRDNLNKITELLNRKEAA